MEGVRSGEWCVRRNLTGFVAYCRRQRMMGLSTRRSRAACRSAFLFVFDAVPNLGAK